MNVFEGTYVSKEIRVGIVAARFNEFIVGKLLEGALDGLKRHEVPEEQIDVAWVPGAFEIPLIASKMAHSGRYDAVICLGAVIRGATRSYRILAATNLTEPFTVGEQTRALSNWNNIQIGLTNPKDVNHNSYFGVVDVKIDNKEGSYVVQNPMKSVLSELTVIIENVPKGTEMSGKADAAWCLFPTQKNSDGEYGLPSIDPTEVEMPTILATESTLQSEVIRLMPTIQGSPASHVYLRLLLPNGTLQEYDITAPAMKVGGKYELQIGRAHV